MQPTTTTKVPLESATTLADYIHKLFPPTQPVEVQNILDSTYHFKYCVDEDIQTPDALSRKVMERKYDEKDVPAGGSVVLMGGAAFVFISEVANAYVFHKHGAEATGNIQLLAEAADKVLIGTVGYQTHAASQDSQKTVDDSAGKDHNPNVVKDDDGNLPPTQPPATTSAGDEDDDEEEFAGLNSAAGGEDRELVSLDGNTYAKETAADGSVSYTKGGEPIDQAEFEAARAATES